MKIKHHRHLISAVFVVSLLAAGVFAQQEKLSADEIIAKHLDSIGTAETRRQMKNYFVMGASTFASKLPERKTAGRAVIVSQDTNVFILKSFASKEYPFEKIGYFSEKLSLPIVTMGNRSPLGSFIADHPALLSAGVFTGSMSTAWPFLEGRKLKGKLDAAGTKKVGGKRVYAVNFFPSSTVSGEFTIQLHFDAETFHHVRTEYRNTISPESDRMGTLGRQTGTKVIVIEKFDNFKLADGMTLPHSYSVNYTTDSNRGTFEYNWGVEVAEYRFNQQLQPGFFSFETDEKGSE